MTRQQTARLVGALYLAMSIPGGLAILYIPSVFVVPDNAGATAARIAAAPGLYRLGVLGDLLCSVFAVSIATVLYDLFEDVDRRQARLLVGFAFGMAAIGLLDTTLMAAPLVLTSGAAYLAAFDKHTLDAFTLVFAGLRSQEIRAATMYWGLWLLPLGILVYRSGFLPRALGILVLIAACSYVIDSLAYYLAPDQGRLIALVSTIPQTLGEMGFAGWMLFKGIRPGMEASRTVRVPRKAPL